MHRLPSICLDSSSESNDVLDSNDNVLQSLLQSIGLSDNDDDDYRSSASINHGMDSLLSRYNNSTSELNDVLDDNANLQYNHSSASINHGQNNMNLTCQSFAINKTLGDLSSSNPTSQNLVPFDPNHSSNHNNITNKSFLNVVPFNPEQSAIALSNDSFELSVDDFNISSQSQLFFVDGAQDIYQNIGQETLKCIAELPTAELRRPLMSIVTRHTSRLKMKELLYTGRHVSKKEWTAARKHCRFPGVGQPVPPKPKYFRKKLNEDIVADFLSWMHANDYIQNVAFGHKIVSYSNGVHTTIEAVKLTTNQRQIVRDFAKEWQESDEAMATISENSASESESLVQEEDMDILGSSKERCCHTCRKTRTQCFREEGHEGRHSFTPRGQLSPSSIEKLLTSMSAGKIKSLAGLDDTDATTGYENFENMRSLVRTLNDVARFDTSNTAQDLISSINSVQQFHKIDFPRHLGQGEILILLWFQSIYDFILCP